MVMHERTTGIGGVGGVRESQSILDMRLLAQKPIPKAPIRILTHYLIRFDRELRAIQWRSCHPHARRNFHIQTDSRAGGRGSEN